MGIAEAEALFAAKAEHVQNAESEYEKCREQVAARILEEVNAVEAVKALKMQKESGLSRVEEARKKLALAQKKHAMLEVMALNQAKMKEFEEAKKRATEAPN